MMCKNRYALFYCLSPLIMFLLGYGTGIADEVLPDGNAALTSCAATTGQIVRDKSIAEGRVAALMEQVKARDAEIVNLKKTIDAQAAKPPAPP